MSIAASRAGNPPRGSCQSRRRARGPRRPAYGELSGVEPESLRFCLETLVTGSDLDPLAFDFEICPWTRRCRACGAVFHVLEWNPACSACGSPDTEAAGGDQMELTYLELEEP